MRNNKLYSTLISLNIALITAGVTIGTALMPIAYSYAAVNPLTIHVTESDEESSEDIKTDETEESEKEEQFTWEIIEVKDAKELLDVARLSTLDTWSQNKYIKLTDDIHLAGSDFEYFPTFGGVFDGNGHTIDGLIINSDMSYLGLFSKLQPNGIIKNLTVGGNITPGNKQIVVGGVVGDNYGTVENCTFEGVVKGNDYTGGIVGYNEETGIIMNCKVHGTIVGKHYTGGIVGANYGGIYRSVNNAEINTSNEDSGMSIEDININTYLSSIMDLSGGTSESKSLDTSNNAIDTGGIVGHSAGVVEFCTNTGNVGYERVGYNVGGIAGRQSGYLHGCKNEGNILGRKDVGGIVGQAEPYVVLDLTEDIVNKLTTNINELHDLVDKTLNDSGDSSDKMSDRLSIVQKFIDGALEDTSYLSGETINFVNGLTTAGNEALSRADYAMDEASKSGGALDKSKDAMNDVGKAADNLKDAVKKADVYGKMSESDKVRYDNDTESIDKARKEHQGYFDQVKDNNYYYYLYTDAKTTLDKSYKDHESDLQIYIADDDGNDTTLINTDELAEDNFKNKKPPKKVNVYHLVAGEKKTFPAEDGDQKQWDEDLIADATADATITSNTYADTQFASVEGRNQPSGSQYIPNGKVAYSVFISDYSNDLVSVVEPYAKQAAEDAQPDLESATRNLSNAAGNAKEAANESSAIFKDLNGRDDITLPILGDGYKLHTSSFVANMQAMSENLGFLNEEMNSSSNTIIDDMSDVNDSFNKIMILFTDAMDGALDGEYADRYEDESFAVAKECTEGTVADCINNGTVAGDLDVSGIAGTMGIEYDFDLEGDVTSNKDARVNSTFKTKCVLRANKNDGRITAQKSYVGGVTGLQEMGTILKCENYGRIASNTGDYVGGIAGNSIASIVSSYSKGIMSGDEYVGGIAGYGHEIYDSYAIPSIVESSGFVGAIAGEVDDDTKLRDNFFVSDKLAGIDRISYSGMAEPVEYNKLLKLDGVPDEFKMLQITFLVEDEEIGTKEVDYGLSLIESQYPESILEEDYYIDWDTTIVHDVTTDMEIVGEPALYRTTIASSTLRENRQSAILVDGKFKASQSIDATMYTESDSDKNPGEVIERWEVSVPRDGADVHQFRVQLPEDVKKASIYVKTDGEYAKVTTTTMGMYHLFEAQGSEVSILIIDETSPMWMIVVIAILVVIIIVIVVLLVLKKNKQNSKEGKTSKKEKRKKRVEKTNKAKEAGKEIIENGIEKAQQLLEEAKDDSPRGEK